MKDGQIEELAREIEMYYGVKRHLEELTKENQVKNRKPGNTEFMKTDLPFLKLPDLREVMILAEPGSNKHKCHSRVGLCGNKYKMFVW